MSLIEASPDHVHWRTSVFTLLTFEVSIQGNRLILEAPGFGPENYCAGEDQQQL
jgi:hypothetical protein